MKSEKIGLVEAIGLISIMIINNIIINAPKEIIQVVGTSSWLNVIYISIIVIFIVTILCTLFKKFTEYDLLDICDFLGGKTLKTIIGILYISLLVISSILLLKNTCEILKLIYFKKSPLIFIALFFLVSAIISNNFSIKVLCKVNLIILPLLILSIFVILLSSMKNFIPQLIFPILGYGAKQTFLTGLTNLTSFSGILYLFFINPFLNKNGDFKKVSLFSVILSGICLFLSVISLILSLTFTLKSGEDFPLYLLARSVEYGRFLQRVDAIFIFIWIISSISYLSFNIFFSLYIFKKLTNLSDTGAVKYAYGLFLLTLVIIPSTYVTFVHSLENFYKVACLILIFGISLLILLFANLKLKFINKEKGHV